MPSPRSLLSHALLASALACPALPCGAAGAPLDAQQVQQAAQAVRADPLLGGKRMERTLRWKATTDKKAPSEQPETAPGWLAGLGGWLAESGRFLVWLLGAAVVALLVVRVGRWARVRGDFQGRLAAVRPSHVRDLDIRPESLPDDIAAAARALWLRHEQRACLSLLYRGALSRLVHHHAVPINAASTEGDCVRLAGRVLSSEAGGFFEGLVGAWLVSVYGARSPDGEMVMSLCDQFDARLPAEPNASAVAA